MPVAPHIRMRRYEDFKAWQLSRELNVKIFQMTSAPPASLDFRFRDNLRDAADSAQRNFPEGFGRFAPGDFAHFLDHSRASLLEVRNELSVGLDRTYFSEVDVIEATSLADRALKALSGLQRYLRSPAAKRNAERARTAFIARRRTRNPTNRRT
jgi:four helix bundle protein